MVVDLRGSAFVLVVVVVLTLLSGVRAVGTTAPGQRPRVFAWPLAPPRPVGRPFTAPAHLYGPGHRGVDLPGTVGEPVYAAADGVVAFARPVISRGVVSVQHPQGLRTTYEPVTPVVTAGAVVHRGDRIALLTAGHDGCPGAPACLHWGLRRGREYLDPLVAVNRPRVRLLPVSP
ncbi:M23 family metallopeptidase [Actinokineospora inagensis]|uniref:M23 family metallopeptidase n=1 Tax=Actinokineospora inagensis TaxID=103730 RepID=UPI000684631E|nr:M23 family metallopeptidase [Actinokineospora inagensis]